MGVTRWQECSRWFECNSKRKRIGLLQCAIVRAGAVNVSSAFDCSRADVRSIAKSAADIAIDGRCFWFFIVTIHRCAHNGRHCPSRRSRRKTSQTAQGCAASGWHYPAVPPNTPRSLSEPAIVHHRQTNHLSTIPALQLWLSICRSSRRCGVTCHRGLSE